METLPDVIRWMAPHGLLCRLSLEGQGDTSESLMEIFSREIMRKHVTYDRKELLDLRDWKEGTDLLN